MIPYKLEFHLSVNGHVKQRYTVIKAKQLQNSPESECANFDLLYLNENTACRNFFIGGPLLLPKLAISANEINQC